MITEPLDENITQLTEFKQKEQMMIQAAEPVK